MGRMRQKGYPIFNGGLFFSIIIPKKKKKEENQRQGTPPVAMNTLIPPFYSFDSPGIRFWGLVKRV